MKKQYRKQQQTHMREKNDLYKAESECAAYKLIDAENFLKWIFMAINSFEMRLPNS